MIKQAVRTGSLLLKIATFLLLSVIISKLMWDFLGQEYVFGNQPSGGDYFNGLTYQTYFSKYLPNPAAGWLPFWNEGSPIIGGYPSLFFYITHPLTHFFDIATAMNISSFAALILFFIFCLLLFWQVSKNLLIAISLVLVIFVTRATYYQLTTGGFIVSASAQWYLPLVLFFIYKFHEKHQTRNLVLAAIFSGLSLIHHAATTFLMIFLPSLFVLMGLCFISNLKMGRIFILTFIFVAISFIIGITGIYTLYLQIFLGSGTDLCQSPQCWGIYPKHLIVWLSPLLIIIPPAFFPLGLISNFIRKQFNIWFILPALMGFSVFVLYALAAHLKLINGPANVIPPTRTFWAGTLFITLIAASSFSAFQRLAFWVSYPLSAVILLLVTIYISDNLPNVHIYRPNSVPADAASYIIPKYQTKPLSELVPSWVPLSEKNWRLDTFNAGLTHWWNIISEMPSTRGYSNYPIGVHRDWQYFLQFATRNPEEKNDELIKNRAMFLLDAYGVGYHDNTTASYPQSILTDPKIIINRSMSRESDWYQLSPNVVSPIVSPSSANPVLFIGDDAGYENFIRTLAMTNLNSFTLIPVKGPQNIGKVSLAELKQFSAVILYQFTGNYYAAITDYIKNGGSVFIDTVSIGGNDSTAVKEPFPIKFLHPSQVQNDWNLDESNRSALLNNINTKDFSPLVYSGGDWKLEVSPRSQLQSWANAILVREDNILMAEGNLGKGKVIWSGINLPYHLVSNNNYEEAKLFKNIINSLLDKSVDSKSTFVVERPTPTEILIEGEGFRGVYFKENYDPGWQASVNNSKAKIYKAGLDFMYILVPEKESGKALKVYLSYRGSFMSWFLFLLTIISLGILSLYILIPKPFRKLEMFMISRLGKNIRKRIASWNNEEE